MRIKLHTLIFIGMLGGVALGLALHAARPAEPAAATWWQSTLWTLDLFGQTMFVGALRMLIAPLIFASIVAAVTSLPHIGELGAIGVKTLVFYLITLVFALAGALFFVTTIRPGESPASRREHARRADELAGLRAQFEREAGQSAIGADQRPTEAYGGWLLQREQGGGTADSRLSAVRQQAQRTPAEIFKDEIVLGMLRNPFASLAGGNAIGIIFFALVLGIACTAIGEAGRPVGAVFAGLSEAMIRITQWVMRIAPLAVLCIMAKLVAETGPDVFESLGWYCSTVIAAIGTHIAFLVLVTSVVGGVGPLKLWRGCRNAMMIAFTTRSSAATLPVSLDCVINKLGVSPKVANFALPVGATVNMDGTAAHQAISVIFLIQMYGGLDDAMIPLTAFTMLLIAAMSAFAAIGAAPMPNAGLVIMAMVAGVAGLPVYYLAFIFAVDSFLDMFRTVVNVLGDVAGAIVVNRLERSRLDEPG